MSSYATLEQLRALAHPDADLDNVTDGELERLLVEAEGDVDAVIGGPRLLDGRALDPALLTDAQRDALARAVAIAVVHRRLLDPEDLVGADSFAPGGLTTLRAGRLPPSPAIQAALAGFGVLRRSMCAGPPPPPPLPPL